MNFHTCEVCQIAKPLNKFYQYKTQRAIKPYSKCKECYPRNPNYVRKSKGFDKLPHDIQVQIVRCLHDRSTKLKTIAKTFGIEYGTFCYWNRKGLIKLIE